MQFRPLFIFAFGVAALASSAALAHSPILACYDEGNNTVLCEAGYSDGASSAGQVIRVVQNDERLILEDKFADDGTFTFERPAVDFYVEFVGDTAHIATFYGEDITP